MRKTLQISGLLSALVMALGVEAAGLGKLSVYSALGQPLRAEIELLSVQKDELAAISAKLASSEAFRQARIDRAEALNALRFSIDQRANGQPILKITSSAPVNDPFLDMLIEVNWSAGRLIREYTILLDPPADLRPAPEPRPVQPPVAAPAAKPAAADAALPEAAPPAEKTPAAPTRYGPVKSGDTLRGIAAKTKPRDVSLDQMMVGLYNRNKGAFASNNMNLLKKGAVLNVPDRDAAMMVDKARAAREVRMHAQDWNAYRQRLAEAAGAQPAAPSSEELAAAGRVVPRVEDKAAPPTAGKDVLKLSKGEPGGTRPDAKAIERIQSLEEELAAKGRALMEAQDRVAQLERAVQDMQRLLQLKGEEAAKPAAPPAAPPVEAPPAEPAPVPEAVAPAPLPQAASPAAAVPAPVPIPEDKPSWLSTFISNPIYIGGIVAAVLLSFLLWMMMVGNRRRKGLTNFEDSIMTGGEFKNEAVFTAGTGAAGAPTGGSALLTDFSRLGLGAIDAHEVDPIAEAEVYMAYGRDAQAEEILKEALAKDPSRHEIALKLLEIYAARKDPVAFETQASELYASLGGQPTEAWMKAAEMGRGIDPDNPLYRIAPGGGPMAAAAATAAVPAVALAAAAANEAPARAEESPAFPDDNVIDFESSYALPEGETGVQAEAVAEAAPPFDELAFEVGPGPAEAVETVEFDLDEALTAMAEAPTEPAPTVEAPGDLDFSTLDLDATPDEAPSFTTPEADAVIEELAAQVPEFGMTPDQGGTLEQEPPDMEPVAEAPAMPDLDFSGIDLELATPATEEIALPDMGPAEAAVADPSLEIDPEVWEETNTKLDLARAYLEMGDHEGAREILQEVLNDGDGKQKDEAKKLLGQAG